MLAELTLAGVLERLIATGIVAAITAFVTLAVVRQQTRDLAEAVRDLTRTAQSHERSLSKLEAARWQCKAEAGRTYATHAAIGQVLSDNSVQWADLRNQMSGLHEKINPIGREISEMKGLLDARTDKPASSA